MIDIHVHALWACLHHPYIESAPICNTCTLMPIYAGRMNIYTKKVTNTPTKLTII